LSGRDYYTDYDEPTTRRCERVLVTLLGDLGPWRERIYLAGGLAPRYLVGKVPEGAAAHLGTTDVDLVIGLALGDDAPETYRTLQNNLDKAGLKQVDSFRWARIVDGVTVKVEFMCETDRVEPGGIFKPKGESLGTKVGAFNVRGANLVRNDFIEREVEGERLDNGGLSKVRVRVANVLPYTVLKIFSFQDRHDNKDAYDLVFTLLNWEGGPEAAGIVARSSSVAGHGQVAEAMALLDERFREADRDGPSQYADFWRPSENERARRRREAVATVRVFLAGFHAEPPGRREPVT
jgi:hypothetical protein